MPSTRLHNVLFQNKIPPSSIQSTTSFPNGPRLKCPRKGGAKFTGRWKTYRNSHGVMVDQTEQSPRMHSDAHITASHQFHITFHPVDHQPEIPRPSSAVLPNLSSARVPIILQASRRIPRRSARTRGSRVVSLHHGPHNLCGLAITLIPPEGNL